MSGPDLASAGVAVTNDVAGYERAKLRFLNGAHSALAYLGLLSGHETVGDAMADLPLARFVEVMVRRDVLPGLAPPAGLDPDFYVAAVFDRFRNPAIRHLLAQIAWEGSQKLPYRLLDPVRPALVAGRPVVDPLANMLLAAAGHGEPVAALLAMGQVFPTDIARDPAVRRGLERACAIVAGRTAADALFAS